MKKVRLTIQLVIVGLSTLFVGCKQDEATIKSNISGTWKVDSTQTVYNGGILATQFGINNDSIGNLIKPVFDGSTFTFNSDLTGGVTIPTLNLNLYNTYETATGAVNITFSKIQGKTIKLNVSSINSTTMTGYISVSDFTAMVNAADTTTTNLDIQATLEALLPTLKTIDEKLATVNFSALGLNMTPTVTLVFKKE